MKARTHDFAATALVWVIVVLPTPIKFGIPPLKRFRITTGGWGESFIVIPLLFVGFALVCGLYYNQLLTLIRDHIVR